MAKDKVVTRFEVNPTDDGNGNMTGLTIQRTERVTRVSDNGKMLDYGSTADVGEPMHIPVGDISDLVRELVDWPIYFADGRADRDREADQRKP